MRMTRSTTLRGRGLLPVALIAAAGSLATAALGATPALARAGGGYRQVNLVSDQRGHAPLRDTDLVNAWAWPLRRAPRPSRVAAGLWALMFGNGNAAKTNELIFSAGPGGEAHGLVGKLVAP
jgi:hypothetical protein